MPYLPAYANAISGIESGGRYDLQGPVTKSGDRAYGRYQIMGANVPIWTKEVLGQSMTPEQFLADQSAQDKVFQGIFGKYVDKYGPEGAARAWFAGEGGMNNPNAKDILGTTVAGYANKFNTALGQPAEAPLPAYSWSPPATPAAAGSASVIPSATPDAGLLAALFAPTSDTQQNNGLLGFDMGAAPQMQLQPMQMAAMLPPKVIKPKLRTARR